MGGMALFRRKRSDASDPAVAIEEFWATWPELRGELVTALDADEPVGEDTARRVTERVRRIHPDLAWTARRTGTGADTGGGDDDLGGFDLGELSAEALADLARLGGEEGDGAEEEKADEKPALPPRYALTVSGGIDDNLRVLAERWRQAAPAEPEWAFHPARQADHAQLTRTLTWDDHELDLSHAQVALRVNHATHTIAVSVFHPDFMFLSDDTQGAVAEHITLLALGEDDMVRWIGSVSALTEKPLDPLPPASMPVVARQLSEALGSGGWITAQARIPIGGTFEISLRHPLSRRDHPAFTLYVLLTLPYATSGSDKLPAGTSAEALEEFGAELRGVMGEHGTVLAQRTMGGQRYLHCYLDPESGVLPEVEKLTEGWPEGRATASSFLDPQWEAIDQIARPLRRKLGR